MPRRDGTGPLGQGSRTGRGMGVCPPNASSNQSFFGFGRGRGFGSGMGFRRMMPWNWNQNTQNIAEQEKKD